MPAGSERVCANPICSVRFERSGLTIEPKRYCSDQCRQQASILKRAARLLRPLGKNKAWEILGESEAEP